jgi:hypothetical protein
VTAPKVTQTRIALNEVKFRDANENIEAAADELDLHGLVPFICECPVRSCVEIVHLTLAEYEEVRKHPARFFNAPGHERISVDAGAGVIAERTSGYVLVDKIGAAAQIAVDNSPKPVGSDV